MNHAPQLKAGTELLGPYQGSGASEVPYLVRRADGTMVQVPRLIYEVAASADGCSTAAAMAARVSTAIGRSLTADDVTFLVDHKLAPAGLLDGREPPTASPRAGPGVLALRARTAVVPRRLVGLAAGFLQPLFLAPVVVAVVVAVAAIDAWLFLGHGVGQGVQEAVAAPAVLLVVAALTIVAGGFHELGHAAACRYGGAEPGAIGVGVYLLWPAFYNDMTDSYRLSRRGRIRADLGGVYFNLVFVVAVAAAYGLTGFEPLLVVIVIQHVAVLEQFLPFLRLDGYYVVSDLVGVPDLFGRIKPVLVGLVPGRAGGTADLKPAARAAVVAWVAVTVPLLAGALALFVVRVPHLALVMRQSLVTHAGLVADAWRAGDVAALVSSSLQVVVLVLPLLGLAALAARGGRSRRPRPAPQEGPEDPPARSGTLPPPVRTGTRLRRRPPRRLRPRPQGGLRGRSGGRRRASPAGR